MIFIWAAIALIALAIATVGLRRAGFSFNLSGINLGGMNNLFSNRWFRVSLGVIIAISLLIYFRKEVAGLTSVVPSVNTLDVIISFGLLIALAVLAIIGKGGWPTKVTLAVVALGFLLLGPTGFFSGYSDFQKGAKEVVLEGKPILSASAPKSTPAPTADAVGVETIVKLSLNECTQTLTVHNNQCLTYREEKMRASTFRPEVYNVSTQAWEAIPVGAFRNARFWRFCATEEDIKLFYSITQKPQEGCKSNSR